MEPPSAASKESDKFLADEMRLHIDELFQFGEILRYSLSMKAPHDAVRQLRELTAWPRIGDVTPPARQLARQKSNIVGDREGFFPWRRQHLNGNECWNLLSQAEDTLSDYYVACQGAYDTISKIIRVEAPVISESDIQGMLESLLMDSYNKLNGSLAPNFYYGPLKQMVSGVTIYYLQLGSWTVGSFTDTNELNHLVDLHKKLVTGLPAGSTIKRLGEMSAKGEQAMNRFSNSLLPNARLRKLIFNGRCELCP